MIKVPKGKLANINNDDLKKWKEFLMEKIFKGKKRIMRSDKELIEIVGNCDDSIFTPFLLVKGEGIITDYKIGNHYLSPNEFKRINEIQNNK